ncbi:trypsin I-P1-like [Atheta coriaria]|uniref:trypsin I-P1-like n=1 Tax=Dalotia coriaria TaxID=877792 RepID=UPI0031F3C654
MHSRAKRRAAFFLVVAIAIEMVTATTNSSGINDSRKIGKFFHYQPYGAPVYGTPSKPIPQQQKCDCGRSNRLIRPEAKIINGSATRPHEYPWMAIISNKGQYLCAGSLITDYHVLTAAHCLKADILRDDMKVILGQHNNCEENSDIVTFSVSDIIRHSRFNPETFAFDLMLLKLNMKVTFGQFIRPICLPPLDPYQRTVTKKYKNRDGIIVGWGTTNVFDDTELSCLPLQAGVPILGLDSCPGYDESLFCAGYLNGEADSCQGDSGGPLQIQNKDTRFELIGIISAGEGCAVAGRPGLYSDVLQNLNWIYKRIAGASCGAYPYGFVVL